MLKHKDRKRSSSSRHLRSSKSITNIARGLTLAKDVLELTHVTEKDYAVPSIRAVSDLRGIHLREVPYQKVVASGFSSKFADLSPIGTASITSKIKARRLGFPRGISASEIRVPILQTIHHAVEHIADTEAETVAQAGRDVVPGMFSR